ncbi:MAG: ATPase [Hadesarchaea archaeon CG08_land_8_20_14_0_20_51_8]|nr:MAG: ATPase [Hadesarchaea archaeon CG08_land_8_20_14_0_20_51_8]
MEIQVTKKSGVLEPFQREKLIKSCMNAGASLEVAEKIADKVAKHMQNNISTSEIRALVLTNLSNENPAWVMKYLEYELTKKKTPPSDR